MVKRKPNQVTLDPPRADRSVGDAVGDNEGARPRRPGMRDEAARVPRVSNERLQSCAIAGGQTDGERPTRRR